MRWLEVHPFLLGIFRNLAGVRFCLFTPFGVIAITLQGHQQRYLRLLGSGLLGTFQTAKDWSGEKTSYIFVRLEWEWL